MCDKEQCCCKCEHQKELMRHPWNKTIGNGSMSETMGWVCTVFSKMEIKGKYIFFDNQHGECEMFCYRAI